MAIQQPKTPYLQIIRRTLSLLLAVALLAGCEKTEERAGLTTTQDEVVLRSTAGSEAAFTVSSTEAWSLTTEGSGFDVSPTQGGRGETTVTVRAQDDNTTTRRKALGSMAAWRQRPTGAAGIAATGTAATGTVRHHTLPPRGCRGFPGAPESPPYRRNAGTSRNHPDMPGLSLLKQKEAPLTGASF